MKKLILILAAAAALTLTAQEAEPEKTFCVGEFENPGATERKWGGGSWWERAPFQWYTVYSGSQIIYNAELLQGLPEDALIKEVVFKYGDDGSTAYFTAKLDMFIENTEADRFELKEGTEQYLWVMMDPSTSRSTIDAYEVELYYLEDEEIHFVLDKPLAYTGGNLLVTAYSERTECGEQEPQAMFDYGVRTDRPTVMSMGSDRPGESFPDCYDTGVQYPYHGPSKYVPIMKLVYTEAQGVADVETADAPAAYFNLQGIPVDASSLAPGIYIRRAAGKTSKVFVK